MEHVWSLWDMVGLVLIALVLSNLPTLIKNYKDGVKAKDDEKWAKRKAFLRATQAKEKSLEQKVKNMGLING